jgi:hypothetical protein
MSRWHRFRRRRRHARVDRRHLQPGVYVIQAGDDGPVKIGVTCNPGRRLAELQTGNHAKLVLVSFYLCATWLIARTVEASVHSALAPFRLYGEWFSVSPETACRTIEEQMSFLGCVSNLCRGHWRRRGRHRHRRDRHRRAA